MPEDAASWGLFAAVLLFVVFLVIKSRLPLTGRGPGAAAARKKIADARRRAKEAGGDVAARAKAWRDAAEVALHELKQPNLAASFAIRAERADPEDASAVAMLVDALRSASRYRALEKLLWRRLAEDADGAGEAHERAFDELLALYEGPLRRPDQAAVLRRFRSRPAADQNDKISSR